jgi:hypothetical protein
MAEFSKAPSRQPRNASEEAGIDVYSLECVEVCHSANFRFTEFSEVQLRDAERLSVGSVMSSSCSQPSPTKE